MEKRKVIIMGAAGRDFHNFHLAYRDNEQYDVKAFTATQIADIEKRIYPAVLAGRLYPEGIPIFPEEQLEELIKKWDIDEVVFAYSDTKHMDVMHKASRAMAAGADFKMMGMKHSSLKSSVPIISICAVRTGVGKSQTTRYITNILNELNLKVVAVRHPMPYGDLAEQVCQRFATFEDLKKHKCTIEEAEEYAPHIEKGNIVYAGVDYEVILREAEKEADVILWDGGNNDMPFYKSDLQIVLVDPHRPGHEISYHPGETNLRMADVIIINKIDSATPESIAQVKENIKAANPHAVVVEAASPYLVNQPELIRGKKVLAIEDGPTITHGEMAYGVGVLASKAWGAKEFADPRPHAVGSIKGVYEKYQHLGAVLPAMGYSEQQVKELNETINNTPADLVVIGTPFDLRRILDINKPMVRVTYDLEERGGAKLKDQIVKVLKEKRLNVPA